MVARTPCFCAIVLVAGVASADDADIKKVAKAKAQEAQNSLVNGELGPLIALTHPKLVEAMGGKEKMAAQVTDLLKSMKNKGAAFKSVTILDPGELIRSGDDLYLTVPLTLEMTVPGGRVKSPGMLIGVSGDKGKTWVFVDAAPGRDRVKQILPDLPPAITFPKKEPPTVIKD